MYCAMESGGELSNLTHFARPFNLRGKNEPLYVNAKKWRLHDSHFGIQHLAFGVSVPYDVWTMKKLTVIALSLALLAVSARAQTTQPRATTLAELEDQYALVMRVMKDPPRAGVLVAELGPQSLAARWGVHVGDIICEYDGKAVESEDALRTAVAGSIAAEQADPTSDLRVNIRVRRASDYVTINLPVGPMGITAIGVEAGVPVPLNPPPTDRNEYGFDWQSLPLYERSEGQLVQHELWTRLCTDIYGNHQIGIERTRVQRHGSIWIMEVLTRPVENGIVQNPQNVLINFTVSDGKSIPPFRLETFDRTADGKRIESERKGATVKTTITEISTGKTTALVSPTTVQVVPTFALPILAAAMPQQRDIVYSFAMLSEADLQTRLGYAMRTLGKQVLKSGDRTIEGNAVEVLHFGRREMIFYFNDQRQFIFGDLGGGLFAERVAGEKSAYIGVKQ